MTEAERSRAIHYAELLQHPSWPYVLQLLKQLEQEATDAAKNFEGWDRDSKCSLMDRMQAVHYTVEEFKKRVQQFALAAQMGGGDNTRDDAARADQLRNEILETRIPGTY